MNLILLIAGTPVNPWCSSRASAAGLPSVDIGAEDELGQDPSLSAYKTGYRTIVSLLLEEVHQ